MLTQFLRARPALLRSFATKSQMLNAELNQNPEFFKAFPHLKPKAEELLEKTQFKKDELDKVNLANDVEDNPGYFESLLHHHKGYSDKNDFEKARDNELHYVDGYHSGASPFKWMSAEERGVVHDLADQKFKEIEETGLTAEEILHDKVGEGLPLRDDPVFQFLKTNRSAREMLFKPGQEFTAENIIELALRQDFGPDRSLANNTKDYVAKNEINPIAQWKFKYRKKNPYLNGEAYFAGIRKEKRKFDDLQETLGKPPTFINRPLSRNELRKKFMRKVNKKDFHWKKTDLLVQFLTPAGKIMSKYQSRLPTSTHRVMARHIKNAKSMGMFPYIGMIKAVDKMPLTSGFEDLEEYSRKLVDPLTGKIYKKNEVDHPHSQKERFERQQQILETDEQAELQMDGMPTVMSSTQLKWTDAQSFVTKKDIPSEDPNAIPYLGSEVAYESLSSKIDENLTIDDLGELFISERALEMTELEHNPISITSDFSNGDITEKTEGEIRDRIANIMASFKE